MNPTTLAGYFLLPDLFPRSKGRTGIYVLHFEDGHSYVGQSIDVVGRWASHRRRWEDMLKLEFARVPIARLNSVERSQIQARQQAGLVLRNVTYALGNPTAGTDLDWIVEPSAQHAWLNKDDWQLTDVDDRVDTPELRARCRDVLTPDGFTMVDDLYCRTFRTVRRAPFSTPANAAAGLADLLAPHPSPGEAVTIARAAQAAVFTHVLLLKVWLPTLINGVSDADHRRLTAAEVRSLRAYRTTWRSSAIVLADADLTPEKISGLSLDQVAPDGTLTGVQHLPLRDDARVFLRAQRQYRILTGATADDPFIVEAQRYIRHATRMGGTELNLPAPSAHQRSNERKREGGTPISASPCSP